jgi:type II secretory pathway predicted ATPase ExeA
MYEAFFGLTEKPFALTPNPKFVFQSEQYRAAEEALLYGVAQREGFMLLTGAPGTSKTTLCRDLLERLDPSAIASRCSSIRSSTAWRCSRPCSPSSGWAT